MAVARPQTHDWLDLRSSVGWIRTERTWQASAAGVIAALRVVTGAVAETNQWSTCRAAETRSPLCSSAAHRRATKALVRRGGCCATAVLPNHVPNSANLRRTQST